MEHAEYIENDAESEAEASGYAAMPMQEIRRAASGKPIKNVLSKANTPRIRPVTVTRPQLVTWRYWPAFLGMYRALRAADVDRVKAAREVAVEVEVLAWALEIQHKAKRTAAMKKGI